MLASLGLSFFERWLTSRRTDLRPSILGRWEKAIRSLMRTGSEASCNFEQVTVGLRKWGA